MIRCLKVLLIGLFFAVSVEGQVWAKVNKKNENKYVQAARKKYSKKKPKKKNIYKTRSVKKIIRRRAKRLEKIKNYKKKKAIGESSDGLIRIRSLASLPSGEQKKLKKMLDAENKDRNRLYRIIMKADGFSKKQEQVFRETMFETYIGRDPVGTFFFEKKYWQQK